MIQVHASFLDLIIIQAASTAAATTSETTGLKVFQIRSEDYKSYQLYSSTEQLRAQEGFKRISISIVRFFFDVIAR